MKAEALTRHLIAALLGGIRLLLQLLPQLRGVHHVGPGGPLARLLDGPVLVLDREQGPRSSLPAIGMAREVCRTSLAIASGVLCAHGAGGGLNGSSLG